MRIGRFLTHVQPISMAPPWVGALLTAMRVPTKNAVQVKKVIEVKKLKHVMLFPSLVFCGVINSWAVVFFVPFWEFFLGG